MSKPDIVVKHTGHNAGTAFFHQIFADLGGEPFPVVAHIARGRPRLVYQAVPRFSPYARIWAKGSEKLSPQSGIDLYTSNKSFISSDKENWVHEMGGNYDKLLALLSEVSSWRRNRSCCWPPGIKTISPVPAPCIESVWSAKSFLGWLWRNLPQSGEWYVEGVGDTIQIDALMVSPGIENHWDSCHPPLCPHSEITSLNIDGYLVTFSSPVYILAATEKGRWFWKGYFWTPNMLCVRITDTATQRKVQASMQGIFGIRYADRERA